MLSKIEIDQQIGYGSDRAFRYYLLAFSVMALGFISIFFVGVGIIVLVLSILNVHHEKKDAYTKNNVLIELPDKEMSSVSKNFEMAFLETMNDHPDDDVDEHNTGSSSLASKAGCAGDRVYDYFYEQTQRNLHR
ncbi:hypothetical protein SJS42_20635 [Aeromonas caviae]|uniref:hypothetical protein n=1 Tax=Aeromonas caviae TaxID=648 RepID=UPI0029DC67D6|nr:hypothetical protein [Aeromonas caviae]MDX7789034.1 hypothetical protein [Aeromonas caviae]MDX7801041.1 hypothetical protein [Aeromonas caviae]